MFDAEADIATTTGYKVQSMVVRQYHNRMNSTNSSCCDSSSGQFSTFYALVHSEIGNLQIVPATKKSQIEKPQILQLPRKRWFTVNFMMIPRILVAQSQPVTMATQTHAISVEGCLFILIIIIHLKIRSQSEINVSILFCGNGQRPL